MATPVLDPEVLSHWGLTGVVVGEERSTFPGRVVYPLRSDQGAFAAKVCPAGEPDPAGEDRPGLLEFLHGHGFPHAPELLRTVDGRATAVVGDSLVALIELLPRPLYTDESERASTWAELGAAAAALNAIEHCAFPFAVPVGEALAHLRIRAAGTHFERAFSAALDRASQVTECTRAALIHGEINVANALRRDDGTIVLVDWDQAGTGPVALEVGYPLIVSFVDEETHRVDEARARSFYGGYLHTGVLEVRPTFAAAVFHALRYMWFGDVDKRWERISWALRNEGHLIELLAG
jgi:Ser/Thr protein kinase RdoA (MazF antagonist)